MRVACACFVVRAPERTRDSGSSGFRPYPPAGSGLRIPLAAIKPHCGGRRRWHRRWSRALHLSPFSKQATCHVADLGQRPGPGGPSVVLQWGRQRRGFGEPARRERSSAMNDGCHIQAASGGSTPTGSTPRGLRAVRRAGRRAPAAHQSRIRVLLPNRLSTRSTASTAVLLCSSNAGLSSMMSSEPSPPRSAIISMHSCASR